MKDSIFYKLIRPIIKVFVNIYFKPKYEGLDNILKNDSIIIAGNHTNIFDPLLIMSSTKRNVHFLAKDELWKFPKSLIFKNLGLIPVNRRKKDKNALELAQRYLSDKKVIGIFPEGTISKTKKVLPFKIGAVKLASTSNAKIVPFSISGSYKFFSKDLKIKFGKPIKISEVTSLEKENEKLRNIIIKMIEEK